MKIIHTSDWHIGKLVHGVHMTEDQKYYLEHFIAYIRSEKPDVIIVAGDLYDRSIPPIDAIELLDQTLSTLIIELGIPVIVIAGNHDSHERLRFASNMLRHQGLHICTHYNGSIEPIIIEDACGPVAFYPIPYLEPIYVRTVLGDPDIVTHEDAWRAILKPIQQSMDLTKRNICIGHALVTGHTNNGLEDEPVRSESERLLSIGGAEAVSADVFEGFDYVALGHLHQPQRIMKDTIRYAGSLLKYSFSEEFQKKSITQVELGDKGDLSYTLIPLPVKRDMRKITGCLADLVDSKTLALGNTEDYIMAVLTDSGELNDPLGTLRFAYPNLLRLERMEILGETGTGRTSASTELMTKQPLALFQEFYENMSEQFLTDEQLGEAEKLLNQLIQSKEVI